MTRCSVFRSTASSAASTEDNTRTKTPPYREKKGPNIASISSDQPASIVRLFNPRTDVWTEHFELRGPVIVGITAIGQATVELLDMNAPAKLRLRSLTGHSKAAPKQ
jgi:hypothetical protein